ncbi:GP88 family protein [Geodermatophilus sp. SYSU D00815]
MSDGSASLLRRSAVRKITNLPSPNGRTPGIANSFGLPAGPEHSCPGATATCERVCYSAKAERYTSVRAMLESNLRALKSHDRAGMAYLLTGMIAGFRTDCERAARRGAVVPLDFRIHWDGDFFSYAYAEAWADTIRANADIRFWVYTRSFDPARLDVLQALAGLPNLTLYLSVDPDNVHAAKAARDRHPWAHWAYLAETFASGEHVLASVSGKRYPCPENGGRIPLITEKGSACIRCGVCLDGRGDVVFSSTKR